MLYETKINKKIINKLSKGKIEKIREKNSNKKEQGITLIALVTTIVISLILASITIGAVTSDNGILRNANDAKEQTEIAEEKEIVDRATIQAMGNNKRGNIVEDELQEQLDKITGSGKTEADDVGKEFEVGFIESKRYYTVDKDGTVTGPQEIVEDKSPGDITKDENGDDIDEDKPYEIWCIEDLVVLSNMSRGKGNYLENGEIVDIDTRNTFSGKNIELMTDLNFNSKYAYADLSITWSYDENENSYIVDENSTENLKDIITDRDGVGFVPIGGDNSSSGFAGEVDGKNHEIQNLFENNTTVGGLFDHVYNATIKNLGLTNINITSEEAGGIAKNTNRTNYYNCYVSGKIKAKTRGGGIASVANNVKIINCYNISEIESSGRVGGLVGYIDAGGSITIVNSYNNGKLTTTGTNIGYHTSSGIIGTAYHSNGNRKIINSCSIGEITSTRISAGNFYYAYGGATVELENAYYLDEIINEKVTVNEGSISFLRDEETVLNNLNKYVEEHKNDYIDEGITLYSWEFDSNGLPTFKK